MPAPHANRHLHVIFCVHELQQPLLATSCGHLAASNALPKPEQQPQKSSDTKQIVPQLCHTAALLLASIMQANALGSNATPNMLIATMTQKPSKTVAGHGTTLAGTWLASYAQCDIALPVANTLRSSRKSDSCL